MEGLGLRSSHSAGEMKKFDVLLSFTFWNGKVCERDFAIKAFEYGNGFDILDRRRFVVVQLRSTLSLYR